MKTLLLVLFFGASVALARSPFEHSALDEFSDEERENLLGELADEENDPKFPLPLFPSTLSAVSSVLFLPDVFSCISRKA